jgi:hydroxymethylpyrimidine/phosphomethylpyrimidine kinase
MTTAMTIAGSDSGGGAGIQADLKTFGAFGVYGTSAITAITAQNTVGVSAVAVMTPEIVAAQISAVLDDIGTAAVKTGMLATAEIVEVVAAAMQRYGVTNLVVDPVMVAKSGDRLLAESAVAALRERLMPLTLVLTPNLPEAEALLGRPVTDLAAMRAAARDLLALGPRFVVVKGGHLAGDEVVDVLVGDGQVVEVASPRIATRHTHGTGCTYAAAIAALLARGASVPDAVRQAHAYLHGAIAAAVPIGAGHGPVHHFYRGVLPLAEEPRVRA